MKINFGIVDFIFISLRQIPKMAKKKLYELWNFKLDGRTNKWLCDKTGIAQSEVSKILAGRLEPTAEQKEKIEKVLEKITVYQP